MPEHLTPLHHNVYNTYYTGIYLHHPHPDSGLQLEDVVPKSLPVGP